jgi:DNA-directed RNA polymerase subunit M/transcription elongation factor TFIIS
MSRKRKVDLESGSRVPVPSGKTSESLRLPSSKEQEKSNVDDSLLILLGPNKSIIENLRYADGRKVVDLGNPNVAILTNLLYKIESRGINSITSKLYKDEKDIIFDDENFEQARITQELHLEIFHVPPEPQRGMYKCQRCNSENTISSNTQRRSADEGQTINVRCLNCPHHWSFNS